MVSKEEALRCRRDSYPWIIEVARWQVEINLGEKIKNRKYFFKESLYFLRKFKELWFILMLKVLLIWYFFLENLPNLKIFKCLFIDFSSGFRCSFMCY